MRKKLTAKRLSMVSEYYFSTKLREIEMLNAQGKDVINLGIGNPDLPPSPKVIEALNSYSIPDSNHKYQSYKGIPEFRSAIAKWYKDYYNVILDSESQILPLIGSKEGIMHISMAFLDDGDEVLVPNPGYPTYSSVTKLAGGIVRSYELKAGNNWVPDYELLEREGLEKVKIMWVNYPHMPTGQKINREQLKDLVDFARKNQIILVNDNPYSFILNDTPVSLLEFISPDDLVLELNSLSKSHNMAGWRVGMVSGNEKLIQTVLTFKSNMDSGMFLPIQKAAIEALKLRRPWFENWNGIYEERRSQAWQLLDLIGCTYDKKASGMFVWAQIPNTYSNGQELSDELLHEAGVFITPGFIFGTEGEKFIRVSLCTPIDKLISSISRIKKTQKIES